MECWSAGAWMHTGIAFMNPCLVTLLWGILIGIHSPGECLTTGTDVDLRSVIGLTIWNAWIHVP